MTKKEIEALQPLMKLSVEANIWSKTIKKHYIKTIASLSNKSEDEIQNELEAIRKSFTEEVKKEYIKNDD